MIGQGRVCITCDYKAHWEAFLLIRDKFKALTIRGSVVNVGVNP